jgi:hypothetical protein
MPEEPTPRLLAGAPWRDRLRPPRPTDAPRWFEPIHVREPGRVRQTLAAQVEAGADVISAPTWLTHRRALMEIGESRRAAEWTRAAVQLAREAIDEGLTRHSDVASSTAILVAGPLPDLDARPESGSGRLAERGAAADRDRDAQAGILADAGVDLIVVEAHSSVEAATRAVEAAAATGLATWATMPATAADELDAWMEALSAAGASTTLLESLDISTETAAATDLLGASLERSIRRDGRSIGVLLPLGRPDVPSARLARWLEAGVGVLGAAEAASPEALKPLREAIDVDLKARVAAREASDTPWRAFVAEGAEWAPRGAALWLEDGDASRTLPDGFAWTRGATGDLGRIPSGAYRFVVARAEVDLRDVIRLLDEGGVAIARLTTDELPRLDDAQVIEVRHDETGALIAVRRAR